MVAEDIQVHPFQADPDVPAFCKCGWHQESRCHGVEPQSLHAIAKASDFTFYSLQRNGVDGDVACLIAALLSRIEILEQRVEELVLKGGA